MGKMCFVFKEVAIIARGDVSISGQCVHCATTMAAAAAAVLYLFKISCFWQGASPNIAITNITNMSLRQIIWQLAHSAIRVSAAIVISLLTTMSLAALHCCTAKKSHDLPSSRGAGQGFSQENFYIQIRFGTAVHNKLVQEHRSISISPASSAGGVKAEDSYPWILLQTEYIHAHNWAQADQSSLS